MGENKKNLELCPHNTLFLLSTQKEIIEKLDRLEKKINDFLTSSEILQMQKTTIQLDRLDNKFDKLSQRLSQRVIAWRSVHE